MAGFTNRGSFDLRPKAKSAGTPRPPNVTIMGQIISVHIESASEDSNAKRGSSQPHLDYMVIGLTHDVPELGLKAEFDEKGEPITLKKISAPIPEGGRGPGPRDIQALSVPKSGGSAMGPGSIAIFEKVVVDPSGDLTCFCTAGGITAEEKKSRRKVAIPSTFACVLTERNKKNAEGKFVPSGNQQVFIADTEMSTVITSDAQLKDLIAYYLAGERDGNDVVIPPSGVPGFFVQARQLAPDDMSDADKITFAENPATRATARVFAWSIKGDPLPGKTKPVYTPPTVDEVIANLWAQHDDIKQVFGNPGYQFEVIPGLMASHVMSKVPSNRRDKKNEKGDGPGFKDSADQYQIIGSRPVDQPNARLKVVAQGWKLSNLVLARQSDDSPLYQTVSDYLVHNKTPIYDTPDIPTPGMLDYHRAAVENQAKVLGALKVEYYIQEHPFPEKGVRPSGAEAVPDQGPSR